LLKVVGDFLSLIKLKSHKMKNKILFFSFFLFQTITILAQDMASLKTEALKSYKASVNMNFDAIFETTYPKVFDIVSQDQMKEMFGQMMENEQFSIKLVEVEPNFSFGEIKKIEGKSFCMVNYNNVMTMKFKQPMDDAESMTDIFKSSMEADKVTYDKATNTFRIEMRSTLIAVADDLTKNKWKFLNKDKENLMFSMLFDEKIVKALGL
jgi:hypothetical protein